MFAPVVGQFVAGFLPGHALGNPLLATTVLLPGLARTVQGEGWVGHLLHALVAHFGEPELDGFGFRAGYGLHQA